MTDSMAGDDAERPPLPSHVADMTQVIRRYRPVLMRYFVRHLRQQEDAEDMTQEVLARFVQHSKGDVAGVDNVEAYLLRMASNALRDRHRRERARHADAHVPIETILPFWGREEPSSERVYEDRAHLQRFLQALDELPPRCHQVFLLQRYDGLTYSAIAKRLGISVSAVEKNMMRALLHLDAKLGGA